MKVRLRILSRLAAFAVGAAVVISVLDAQGGTPGPEVEPSPPIALPSRVLESPEVHDGVGVVLDPPPADFKRSDGPGAWIGTTALPRPPEPGDHAPGGNPGVERGPARPSYTRAVLGLVLRTVSPPRAPASPAVTPHPRSNLEGSPIRVQSTISQEARGNTEVLRRSARYSLHNRSGRHKASPQVRGLRA